MNAGISAINEQVKEASAFLQPLMGEINKVVIGQKHLVERLIVGLLADGPANGGAALPKHNWLQGRDVSTWEG